MHQVVMKSAQDGLDQVGQGLLNGQGRLTGQGALGSNGGGRLFLLVQAGASVDFILNDDKLVRSHVLIFT